MTANTQLVDQQRLHQHTQRLDWMALAPNIFKAMVRLDTATGHGVDATLLHLVKIRSSQLNRCAYCIDMHTTDALAAGESVGRIIQLDAWPESKHFYTAKEIAAIELTERSPCSPTDSSRTTYTNAPPPNSPRRNWFTSSAPSP